MSRIGTLLIGLLLGGAAVGGAFVLADDDDPVETASPLPSATVRPSVEPTASPLEPSPSVTEPFQPVPVPLAESDLLRLDGIGALTIGMTVQEMEEATGMHLRIFKDFSPGCRYSQFDGGPKDLHLMLSNRVLVRVDVNLDSALETDRGIAIGDPIGDVETAYGDHLTREPHPYLGNRGSYLIYDEDAGDGLLLIFESDRKEILSFRSGYDQPVRYIEGCA